MARPTLDKEKINNFFTGKYSEEDLNYVNEVFCDETREEDLKTFMRRQWHELKPNKELTDTELDNLLYRVHYEINSASRGQKRDWSFTNLIKWSSRIAAILLLPMVILLFANKTRKTSSGENISWVEIKAPAWTRAQFSLPDGTTGWLNSNSSIKYNTRFKTDRQISLKGEALFDVFEDKANPFTVIADGVSITALGTRFNVASYADEEEIEIVLEEGKLEVQDPNHKQTVIMHPDDFLSYSKSVADFRVEITQPQKFISWTEGKLIFRNDPIDVVARRIGRWYNVDVEVKDGIQNDLRLRATFIDESLEEVLNLLQRSLPVSFRIEERELGLNESYSKKKVIITPKLKR